MLTLLILLAVAYAAGVATPVVLRWWAGRHDRRLELDKKIDMLRTIQESTDQKLRALEWEREYKETK